MSQLMKYLELAVSDQASDIFLVSGGPVSEKKEGHLKPIGDTRLLPPDTKGFINWLIVPWMHIFLLVMMTSPLPYPD